MRLSEAWSAMPPKARKTWSIVVAFSQRELAFVACICCLLGTEIVHGANIPPGRQYLQVHAELELINHTAFPKQGVKAGLRRKFSVNCTFGPDAWRIEHNHVTDAEQVWFSDGTNVFTRTIVKTNAPTPAGIQTFNNNSNITVRISSSPGGHPLSEDVVVNIAWLAFCSGPYLKRPDRDIPLPTSIIRDSPENFAYSDRTEVYVDPLGLPKTLELFTSKARYSALLEDPRVLRNRTFSSKPSFADKVLHFRYTVDETTNLLGWNVPLRFNYTSFHAEKDGRLVPFVGGIGRVSYLGESTQPENVLLPNEVRTVVDFRFRHPTRRVDGIIYKQTNMSAPPALTNPVLQEKLDNL